MQLLSQAQESLSAIDKSSLKNIRSPTFSSLPKAIGDLQVENGIEASSLSEQDTSYYIEMIHRIKLQLKLPEYGEVRVELTLDRTGKVHKLYVLSSSSLNNQKYIEKNLTTVHFPPFGSHFPKESIHKFLIAISNDF